MLFGYCCPGGSNNSAAGLIRWLTLETTESGSANGGARRSYIFRSTAPYSIDEFERVWEGNFSYANPRWVSGEDFLFLHTRYERGGRSLYWMTSRDGLAWSEPQWLARVELGHYQIVQQTGRRVATAFNFHPAPVPVTRPEHPDPDGDALECRWRARLPFPGWPTKLNFATGTRARLPQAAQRAPSLA